MTKQPRDDRPSTANGSGLSRLSDLEQQVMEVIWQRGPSTAEEVRRDLEPEKTLKDSTVRTVLRRLEGKAFLTHDVDGRTYIYRALAQPGGAAAQAVRQVIDRFCGGSVEELLLGLVDHRVVDRRQLEHLKALIDASQRSAHADRTREEDA